MSQYRGEPESRTDGAECRYCGEDATGVSTSANAGRVPTCGDCHDSRYPCADCEGDLFDLDPLNTRIGQAVYCQRCAAKKEEVIAATMAGLDGDDFNEVRR